MALPVDLEERCVRLMGFKDDINKLANYIGANYPKEINQGEEAVDIAIRILESKKSIY